MSKSFVKTLAYNQTDLSHVSLASSPLEQRYKGILIFLILAPVVWLGAAFISNGFESAVLVNYTPVLVGLLAAVFAFVLVTFIFFYRFYRRPLNANFACLYLRKNETGWWLGKNTDWQLLELGREALVTPYLIILPIKLQGQRFCHRLWLWRDGVGVDTHRSLRVLLRQGRY